MRTRVRIAAGAAVGVVALGLAFSWPDKDPSGDGPRDTARQQRPDIALARSVDRPADPDALERRVARLESRLEAETQRAQQLQQRLDQLSAVVASTEAAPDADAPPSDEAPAGRTAPHITGTESGSPLERALQAAGLDATTAEGIKRRGDEIAMTEMYLRDQATREGWLDTPRFQEEMDAIEQQRTSIRDEIGDDAYDRYLFALGHTNRIIVNDVMFQSVAEEVGLQTGDLILRYGDAMLFAPDELVAQTHSGPLGEAVTLEVMRGGKRIEVQVPRGPLGLRIGPAQDHPG